MVESSCSAFPSWKLTWGPPQYMVCLNRFCPSLSMLGLMSSTVTWVSRSKCFVLAWSRMRRAMSPVPPATSRTLMPPRGSSLDTKWSFQSLWTPRDIASFITSYLEATDEKTEATIDSLSSSATVLKPKWVCLFSGVDPSMPKLAEGRDEENAFAEELDAAEGASCC